MSYWYTVANRFGLGTILVYNIGSVLKSYVSLILINFFYDMNSNFLACPTIIDLFPTHHLTVHQSVIRALGWIKAPPYLPSGVPQDPTTIASGGYARGHSLMEPLGPVWVR